MPCAHLPAPWASFKSARPKTYLVYFRDCDSGVQDPGSSPFNERRGSRCLVQSELTAAQNSTYESGRLIAETSHLLAHGTRLTVRPAYGSAPGGASSYSAAVVSPPSFCFPLRGAMGLLIQDVKGLCSGMLAACICLHRSHDSTYGILGPNKQQPQATNRRFRTEITAPNNASARRVSS